MSFCTPLQGLIQASDPVQGPINAATASGSSRHREKTSNRPPERESGESKSLIADFLRIQSLREWYRATGNNPPRDNEKALCTIQAKETPGPTQGRLAGICGLAEAPFKNSRPLECSSLGVASTGEEQGQAPPVSGIWMNAGQLFYS